MKRKDVDEVNDDFFDFILSCPALKIRRLDAEMLPITDEQESVNSMAFGQSMPFQDAFVKQSVESSPIAIDELSSSVPGSEEGAIVLYNPNSNTPLHSPPPFSISVDSDLLSSFKNPVIWSNRSNAPKSLVDGTQEVDDKLELSNGCLAVVPWVPSHSQQHSQTPDVEAPGAQISEMMDTDAMDIEDNYNIQQISKDQCVTPSVLEVVNQWRQHCMIQPPPSYLSSPITWFGRGA